MDKRTQILDAAERRARKGGYNGFSFRDIAEDVGIKSASVHYHFPTKDDLANAIVERYTERTIKALGKPEGLAPQEAFDKVAALFITSDERDDLMCLCGVLGAEAGMLAPPLVDGVSTYFDTLTDWLSKALEGPDAAQRARQIVAALEGGLIVSRVKNQPAGFRALVADLRAAFG